MQSHVFVECGREGRRLLGTLSSCLQVGQEVVTGKYQYCAASRLATEARFRCLLTTSVSQTAVTYANGLSGILYCKTAMMAV